MKMTNGCDKCGKIAGIMAEYLPNVRPNAYFCDECEPNLDITDIYTEMRRSK